MLDVKNGYELQWNNEMLTVRGVEHWDISSANGPRDMMTQTINVYAPPAMDLNGKRGEATLAQSDILSTDFLPLSAGEIQMRPDLKTPHLLGQMFLDGTDEILRVIVERKNYHG